MASLDSFGFTPTETKVYEALLRLGPSTGYAVARESGYARANTYQALDGLVRHGAARRSATIPARYAAFAPETVVAELERRMRRDLESLAATLKSLPRAPSGPTPDPPSTIANVDDVVDHALAQITPLLREALRRGISGT